MEPWGRMLALQPVEPTLIATTLFLVVILSSKARGRNRYTKMPKIIYSCINE